MHHVCQKNLHHVKREKNASAVYFEQSINYNPKCKRNFPGTSQKETSERRQPTQKKTRNYWRLAATVYCVRLWSVSEK